MTDRQPDRQPDRQRIAPRTPNEPPTIIHTFPLFVGRDIEVGDVALCGGVKSTPGRIEDIPPHRRERCVVCADLTGCHPATEDWYV